MRVSRVLSHIGLQLIAIIAILIAFSSESFAIPGVITIKDVKLAPSKQMLVTWTIDTTTYPAPSGPPGTGPTSVLRGYLVSYLNRSPTGTGLPVYVNNMSTSYTDTDWLTDTRYTYTTTGYVLTWDWSPSANGGMGGWVQGSNAFTFDTEYATVRKVNVTSAQTVDTRLDLRFSTIQLVDFDFAQNTYRGGLFAGYNADGSRVARTYLKFTSITGPINAGEKFWPAGGLFLYSPRLSKQGTVSLLCRKTTSATWPSTGLTWSAIPGPLASGTGNFSITWNTGGAGQWIPVNELAEIENLAGTANPLSMMLYSPSEDSANPPMTAGNGWAYFARSQYQENGAGGFDAYLLYVYGGQGAGLQSIYNTPAGAITGGTSTTGGISLYYPAPTGGITATLTSNDSSVTVPATATIAAGQLYGNFTISTTAVSAPKNVTITATYGNTVSTVLTINPYIQSLAISPSSVKGGTNATGTVTLYAAAPSGGLVINLSSNDPSATVPATITIPAGLTSYPFTVTTTTVTVTKNVTISATKGSTVTAPLTVTP